LFQNNSEQWANNTNKKHLVFGRNKKTAIFAVRKMNGETRKIK
jgi:hypothetical protein